MCIFLFLGVYFIAVENFTGKTVGALIIYLLFIWWSRGIYSVSFMDDHLIKKQKYSTLKVNYGQIFSCYKNREGFAPVYIFVIKFNKDNGKIGKITFDATSEEVEFIVKKINQVNPDIHLWVKE